MQWFMLDFLHTVGAAALSDCPDSQNLSNAHICLEYIKTKTGEKDRIANWQFLD